MTFWLVTILWAQVLPPNTTRSYDLPDFPQATSSSAPSSEPSLATQKSFDPLAFLLRLGIRGYQETFSKIQGDVCNFAPSCSHFAVQALQSFGAVKGLLLASDRLQRCNYWAWQLAGLYYGVRKIPERGPKLVDPVERYR